MRFSERQLDDLRDRKPCHEVAGDWVRLRKIRARKGFTHEGPCPFCSKSGDAKDDSRFAAGPLKWACAAGCGGGDVFGLVMKHDGIDFVAAVEILGGVREIAETPETAKRAGRKAHDAGLERHVGSVEYALESPALVAHWLAGWDAGAVGGLRW